MRRASPSAGEWVWCVLLFGLGLTIMIASLQVGFGRFTRPGPGLFPFFCGLILAVQSVVQWAVGKAAPEGGAETLRHPGALPKFVAMTAVLILWIVLMPLFGWIPLTFLATLAVAKIMAAEGWVKPLLLAGGNSAFLYLLFGYLLAIDLPTGFWG